MGGGGGRLGAKEAVFLSGKDTLNLMYFICPQIIIADQVLSCDATLAVKQIFAVVGKVCLPV